MTSEKLKELRELQQLVGRGNLAMLQGTTLKELLDIIDKMRAALHNVQLGMGDAGDHEDDYGDIPAFHLREMLAENVRFARNALKGFEK